MHAVVMPLFGDPDPDLYPYLVVLGQAGLDVVLVDNNPVDFVDSSSGEWPCRCLLKNGNKGGIAGGLNSGVAAALQLGAEWITLLDQDSRLEPEMLQRLREPWSGCAVEAMVVGPIVWDRDRQERHGRVTRHGYQSDRNGQYECVRLLISSGTTFRALDWPLLGRFHEDLFIDFVDHAWCFRAQARGFVLLKHPGVQLQQRFGRPHPNSLCRWAGLQLYSSERHYHSLRNLRWLVLQPNVPLDLKLKECAKMLVKPWCWLAFEPKRIRNLQAILSGLFDPLPSTYN